jgi:hypothetical protein
MFRSYDHLQAEILVISEVGSLSNKFHGRDTLLLSLNILINF